MLSSTFAVSVILVGVLTFIGISKAAYLQKHDRSHQFSDEGSVVISYDGEPVFTDDLTMEALRSAQDINCAVPNTGWIAKLRNQTVAHSVWTQWLGIVADYTSTDGFRWLRYEIRSDEHQLSSLDPTVMARNCSTINNRITQTELKKNPPAIIPFNTNLVVSDKGKDLLWHPPAPAIDEAAVENAARTGAREGARQEVIDSANR
jgi:hypothetical protein